MAPSMLHLFAEVSALRAAAAAAIAEFNGPLDPSLQLTAPDKAHELGRESTSSGGGTGTHAGKGAPRGGGGASAAPSTSQGPTSNFQQRYADLQSLHQPGMGSVFTQRGCPPHGAKAICGRRPRMEDAYTAVPFLLEVISAPSL